MPLTTRPKAVYLPFRLASSPSMTKNWLPAEFGSGPRAIPTTPRTRAPPASAPARGPARFPRGSRRRRASAGDGSCGRPPGCERPRHYTYSTTDAIHASRKPGEQPEPGHRDQDDGEGREPEVGRAEHPEPPLAHHRGARRDRRVVLAGEQTDDDRPQATPLFVAEPHELEADLVGAHRLDDGLLDLDGALAGHEVERGTHRVALGEPRRRLRREALERELRRLARRARVAAPEDDGRADGDALPLAAVSRPPHVARAPMKRPNAAAAELAAERIDVHARQRPLESADAVAAPSPPAAALGASELAHADRVLWAARETLPRMRVGKAARRVIRWSDAAA